MKAAKLKKVIAGICLLSVVGGFLFAHAGYAEDRVTGTISGQVYSASTGNPVSGAAVTLTPSTSAYGATSITTTTDAQGNYSVSNVKCYYLPDGTWSTLTWLSYSVSVSANGYDLYQSGQLSFYRGSYSIAYDVALKPVPSSAGIISGLVIDYQTRKPIANGLVVIKPQAIAYGSQEYRVTTNAQGYFSANVLRYVNSNSGGRTWLRYTINIAWQGYNTYTSPAELAFSETSIDHFEEDILLYPSPTGILSGTVTDANTNKAIPNVTVTFKTDGFNDHTAVTDANGNYKITDVNRYISSSGGQLNWLSYTAYVNQPGYAPYIGAKHLFSVLVYDAGENIALKPMPTYTGTITGIVTDSQTKQPIANGGVLIKDVAYGLTYNVSTDSQGRYTATVQRSKVSGGIGTYYFRYTVNIAWQGYIAYTSPELSFSESTTNINHNVSLVPQETGILSGTVTNANTGEPVSNIVVTFIPDFSGATSYTATTNTQGKYKIENVRRYITNSGGQTTWFTYKAYVTDNSYLIYTGAGKTFSVLVYDAGEDIKLRPKNDGTITGIVTDAQTQKPLANVVVLVKDTTAFYYPQTVTTDSQGRYIAYVPPSHATGTSAGWQSYRVSITLDGYNFYTSSELTFSEGVSTIEHNVALASQDSVSGTITGIVTDSLTKQPLAHIAVAIKEIGLHSEQLVYTDAQGKYTVSVKRSQLINGTIRDWFRYTVNASGSGYDNYTSSVFSFAATVFTINQDVVLTPAKTDTDRFTGTISGRVYDAGTGQPVSAASITLRPDTYAHGEIDYVTTTDAQGNYKVSNMKCCYAPDGTWSTLTWLSYKVSVSANGYETDRSDALAFSKGNYSLKHDVALKYLYKPEYLGTITGIITDSATKQPIANGAVLIKDVAYGITYSVQTDAQGRYVATVQRSKVSGGMGIYWYRYTVSLVWAGYEAYTSPELAFSESVTTINHDVALKPVSVNTGTITGIVTNSRNKKPLANIEVSIIGISPYIGTQRVTTDSQGMYTASVARNRASGTSMNWESYSVSIIVKDYNVYTSHELTFSEGVFTINHNVALMPMDLNTGSITGIVTDSLTKQPLVNIAVLIRIIGYGGEQIVYTDFHGRYFCSVWCGKTNNTEMNWYRYTVNLALQGYEPYTSPELPFSEDVYTINHDVALKPVAVDTNTGTISGRVIDSDTQKPIVNASVLIAPCGSYPPGIQIYPLSTDVQGYFSSKVSLQVPSECQMGQCWMSYTVHVDYEGYKDYTSECLVFSDSVRSHAVNVSLVGQPTGSLSGVITDSDTKQPIPGTSITIKPNTYAYGAKDYNVIADAQGKYQINDVLRFVTTSSGKLSWLSYTAYVSQPGYEPYVVLYLSFIPTVFDLVQDIQLTPVAAAQLMPDVYLDTSTDSSVILAQPQIITDDAGYVVVAWQAQAGSAQSNDQLRSRTSVDSGVNWEPVQTVSFGASALQIDDAKLGSDGKGDTYLSWRSTEAGHQYLYVSRAFDHGFNWQDGVLIKDTLLNPTSSNATSTDVSAGSSAQVQNIHLKCQDNNGGVYILETENIGDVKSDNVVFAYSLDRGETWNELNIGKTADFLQADMACDNNGNVYIVGANKTAVLFKAIAVRQK